MSVSETVERVEKCNLIAEYTNTISKHLDAPEIFIVASAYHLVSNLLGRFFYSRVAPGPEGMKPNAWIIISSIPARGRRSTVANYANKIYEKTSRMYYSEYEELPEDYSVYQRIVDTYIEQGTPEGIIDHIQHTGFNDYFINSPEFGSVLQAMSTKQHELGVATLYSKLYYGEGHSYYLSRKVGRKEEGDAKRYLKANRYVTMFCGIQEPHIYITPDMLRQGLIRRILIIYADKEQFGTWMPPLSTTRSELPKEFARLSKLFFNRMSTYHEYAMKNRDVDQLKDCTIDMEMHPVALNMINDYAKVLEDALIKDVNNVTIYKQTMWEHLAKYSILHAIARDSVHKEVSTDSVCGIVSPDDVKVATRFIEEATMHTDEIIGGLGRIDEPVHVADSKLERIYSIIKANEPIARSQLYRKAKMKKTALNELINTLILQERVEVERNGSIGGAVTYGTID